MSTVVPAALTPDVLDVVARVARRANALASRMIDDANHRDDVQEGDPKVGGHQAACASCIHIFGALQLAVAGPFDTFAVKPHASPVNHAYNFLLGLFKEPGGRRWLSLDESQGAMTRLRRYSFHGEPVFQSYHAENDPDGHGYFPSGSVGIPPVVSVYTSLAYRYAKHHGHEVPENAHHWSLMGDSEFREGSLLEVMPEAAERELNDVTWIVDYNRQSLDGTRITGERGLGGTDAERIVRTARANGWIAHHVMHGRQRQAAFARPGGEALRDALENGITDYEFQALLHRGDGALTRRRLIARHADVEKALEGLSDAEVQAVFADLAGHDVQVLAEALAAARDDGRPTMLVVHTIKGWGQSLAAQPGNHSSQLERDEVRQMLVADGIDPDTGSAYQRFDAATPEGAFLEARGNYLRGGFEAQWALKDRNFRKFTDDIARSGELPTSLSIDLKFTPVAHTQYVWGQALGKVIRIGTGRHVSGTRVSEQEKPFEAVADHVLTMAPDVGTSTNINPAMDQKIYGPALDEDFEKTLELKERGRPLLHPREEVTTRHIRFEIAEANAMSAAGAFGKLVDSLGIPYMPVMTVYDFFIKRAYDQLYYNLYWGSNFLLVGTPSGITLAPEGAQHSWKSDIQMPNMVTWEPMYGVEVDWIVAETLRRHATRDNKGRTGVILRCVTRGLPQKDMLVRLRRHKRFKASDALLRPAGSSWEGGADESTVASVADAEILEATRRDVLAGGYYLVDYRGYAGYEPGENVVNIVAMGAMGTSAVEASDLLLKKGIYANVILATSPDLLAGNQADADGYVHLREGLGLDGALHLTGGTQTSRADIVALAAARVPLVSVVDGEPGILDNLGSIVGTRQIALGLRKPSKCGRPTDVYHLHHMDGESVAERCMEVLGQSALGTVQLSAALARELASRPLGAEQGWQAAWGSETVEG